MTEEVNDVTQEETTSETPSVENETTETTQEETQEDSKVSKTVPYERFSEVNNKLKEYERKTAEMEEKFNKVSPTPANPQEEIIKQQFKKIADELGYVSKTELEQKEASKALQQTVKDLQAKYDGKDGRPKFDYQKTLDYAEKNLLGNLEVAYKAMNEPQLMDWAIKAALGKTKGVKSEVSDGSGSSEIGTTQGDLLNAAAKGDSDAISTLIKRTLS